MSCDHVNCGRSDKLWLPYIYRGHHYGLKPHTYCVKCGMIKSIAPLSPHSLEHYIAAASNLGKYQKMSKVQLRLISKDLERSGIDDNYGMDRYSQDKLFIEIVRRYFDMPEHVIWTLLESDR